MYITHWTCLQLILARTDPAATVQLFSPQTTRTCTGHLERHSSSGGGADDRLDILDHAADGGGGGGRAYEHVHNQGGQ